jgi:hypothetical protein
MAKKETSQKENSRCSIAYTVDSFANGIAFGQHRMESAQDPRDYYWLRLQDDSELVRLRSRYALHKENPFQELEKQLSRLSKQGVLSSSTVYFGTTTDPFLPFEGKFDASMKFLDIFQRYQPGMLVIQTRSPLVVIAMPVLRKLGKQAAVTIGIETCDEKMVQRYTPTLPRVQERLKTANALRNFGIEVTLQVSPVLPYGDWKEDAPYFARMLCGHADYVHIRPLTDGTPKVERQIRNLSVSKSLAMDRKFHWLRPDSALPLLNAVEQIAPEKLLMPKRQVAAERQLSIFAA